MPRSQAKASRPARHSLLEAPARVEFREALARWYREAGRDLPWRRTEDGYAILVSELMLQQTQVATVVPFYQRWLARFPDVAALAAATEEEVLGLWQGLGYYARARNLHRAAQAVVEHHGGEMPRAAETLHALPGVGRYTAGAVASFAYDAPEPAVDANIARVLARLFDVREEIGSRAGQEVVWEAARRLMPEAGGREHNSALMELGALVCVARAPRCLECPVRSFCSAELPELLPVKRARRTTVALEESCGWSVSARGVLLERQEGARWRGLWKLPPLEPTPADEEEIWREVYPFTHHRVTLRVFPARGAEGEGREWFAGEALHAVAVAAGHRRAIEGLLGRK